MSEGTAALTFTSAGTVSLDENAYINIVNAKAGEYTLVSGLDTAGNGFVDAANLYVSSSPTRDKNDYSTT